MLSKSPWNSWTFALRTSAAFPGNCRSLGFAKRPSVGAARTRHIDLTVPRYDRTTIAVQLILHNFLDRLATSVTSDTRTASISELTIGSISESGSSDASVRRSTLSPSTISQHHAWFFSLLSSLTGVERVRTSQCTIVDSKLQESPR